MSKVDGQILNKEKTKNLKLKINSGKNHIIPKNKPNLPPSAIRVICVTISKSNYFHGKIIILKIPFQIQRFDI
jgi:hypothetical protein